jgi:fibronectin-binding autotransporter adhesin
MIAVLAFFALFGFNAQSLAATDTWAGSTLNFADPNWVGANNPPVTGDSLVFTSTSTAGTALVDNLMTPATFTIGGISFASGALGYTINAGTVGGVASGFTLTGNITNSASVAEIIDDNIIWNTTTAGDVTSSPTGPITLGGNISGAGNIIAEGPGGSTSNGTGGIVTISGSDTYTGNTQITTGTIAFSNATLGSATSRTGGLLSGLSSSGAATVSMTFSNSTVYANTFTETQNATNAVVINNSTLNMSGALAVAGNVSGGPTTFILNSGTVSAASATVGKDNATAVTSVTTATSARGIQVNGGLLNIAGTMTIGNQNSDCNTNVAAGTLTVGGALTIQTASASARLMLLSMNNASGVINANGGIVFGNEADSAGLENLELLTIAGTLNTTGVAFDGDGGSNAGFEVWLDSGATSYIGTGGITKGSGSFSSGYPVIQTGAAAAATVTLAASAPWSTVVPIAMSGTTTFQTANSIGTAENITINSVISGATGIVKTGAGTLFLSSSNSFTGNTTINVGTISLSAAQTTTAGPLGGNSSPLSLPTGNVVFNGGTLQYTSLNTTDYSSHFASTSTAADSLDLNGQNATIGTQLTISNAPFGLTVQDIAGGGSLTLSQAETFGGTTTVNSGKVILISGASLTGGATINGGTLFAKTGSGPIGGALSIGSSANLSMQDGTIGSLTIGGNAAFGGATTGGNLDLDISGVVSSVPQVDSLIVDGTISFGTTGLVINLTPFTGGTAPAGGTQYTIITDANGGLGTGSITLSSPVVNIDGQNYFGSLSSSSADDEILTLTVAALNYYWTGHTSTSWNALANFATDHTGATTQTQPVAFYSNIFLTADSASSLTQTLDGNYTINSLNFTGAGTSAGSAGVTLSNGSGSALTITGSNSYSDTVGNNYNGVGLVVQPGAAADTIGANIVLGGNQTWEINNSSSNPLTVSGTVSGIASLGVNGTGKLILTSSNSYSGGTTISGATVKEGANNAIGSGSLTVSGGTLDLAGFNQTVTNFSDGTLSAGTITASTGSSTLTINNSASGSFSGAITGGIALNINGSANLTLSGSNSYAGLTTLSGAQTLVAANNNALGSPSTGGLNINPSSGTGIVDFTSSNPAIGSLASSGTARAVLGNTTSNTPTTLTVGGAGLTTVFGGNISDANTVNGATGNLVLTGGSLTLGGSDSYTGTTVVQAGTLVLTNANALGSSTLNDNNTGGTLDFSTLSAATFGGLEGSQNIALTNDSAAALSLTVGGNGATNTYSGVLSGLGSLTINGGSTTLSGSSTYAGVTTLNTGSLTVTGGIGTSATPSAAITQSAGTFNINGGNVYAASLSSNSGATVNLSGGGSLITPSTGVVAVNSNNNAAGAGLLTVSAGAILTTGSITIGRDSQSITATPSSASITDGVYINGGAVTVLGNLDVGSNNTGDVSSNSMRMDAGTLTVGGYTQITNDANNRWSVLDIAGGIFNEDDTSGVGILIGGNVSSNTIAAILILRNSATINTSGITLGNSQQTGGTDEISLQGGTLNLGSGGITHGESGTALILNFGLSGGSALTVGALASWSTGEKITLTDVATGSTTTTFQTSAGNNITLNGQMTGGGGLNAAGGGVVTLGNTGNSYTGATNVLTGGTLVVSGSVSATSGASIAAGGNLEVDNALITTGTVADSGKLSGIGTITGPVSAVTGAIAPGLTLGSTAVGTLTVAGSVSLLDSASTLAFRLGLNSATDNDQLAITSGGTLTLTDSLLSITVGPDATVGTTYTLVLGGAGLTSGVSGTDSFSNADTTAGTVAGSYLYTNAQGDQFNVVYGGDSSTPNITATLELAPIPEPGTWASLIGGLGMLVVWQKRRRRS